MLRRFIQAYRATGATAHVFVRIDNDDPQQQAYMDLMAGAEWPHTWKLSVGPRMKCPEACEWFFQLFPKEPYYSLFGDDVVPETRGWDQTLIAAAGTKRVSYGRDPKVWPRAPHPVVGGDLVRAVGYYALPGVLHWYMDTLWEWLAQKTGRLVQCPNVMTPHYNPDLGNGQNDQTYDDRWLDLKTNIRHGSDYDVNVWKRWHASGEALKAIERIRQLCPL